MKNFSDRPRRNLLAAVVTVFALMLFLNCMTPYVADDYVYMFSFYNHRPIREVGVLGIVKSMYSHAYTMNGRVVSHAAEQVFMIVPKLVFNIFNSSVFVLTVYLIYRIVNCGKTRNCLLFIASAAAVWCVTPAFGQVCLWQVGSINYLWGICGGLIYLMPFLYEYMYGTNMIKTRAAKTAFCVFAFVNGFYCEISSLIVIVAAAMLVILVLAAEKGKVPRYMYTAEFSAVWGYVLLLMMPAEIAAKSAGFDTAKITENFIEITKLFKEKFGVLAIVWTVLFVIGCAVKISRKRLALSAVFAFCALCAGYIMISARYIPERCLITSAVFSMIAAGILIPCLAETRFWTLVAGGGVILMTVFAFWFAEGCADILNCRMQIFEREQRIEQMKKEGEEELKLPIVRFGTKYSAFYGLVDLQTEESGTWPNVQMSQYYGVKSILGTLD